MALKVDMGKACSHVEWEFIRSRGRAKKKKKSGEAILYVEWEFQKSREIMVPPNPTLPSPLIRRIMLKLGFSNQWVTLLMQCISTVNYSIVVNG